MSDPYLPTTDISVPCLFGAGGHGLVVAVQLWRFRRTRCVFADVAHSIGATVAGFTVVGNTVSDVVARPLLMTIGDNSRRAILQGKALALGATVMTALIEPDHYLSEHAPGPGSQILSGALVNVGARIGSGVIINSKAVVEHDAVVGDFCHLAPGSVIGGEARLDAHVFLGTNATVLPRRTVASGVTIGAGAVVTRDITQAGTYVGVPARPLSLGDRT